MTILMIVLVLMNTYPLLVSQDLVFRSKHTTLQAGASSINAAVTGLEELTEGCRYWQQRGAGYTGIHPEMPLDFPKPEFYHQLFRLWELE